MSLDKNLFTLLVTPNKDDPNVIDLVDPAGTIHYRKQRVPGSVYRIEIYDPASESLLITATAPSSTSKAKTLELCNPTSVVELKYTGTLSFRWGFKWEEHEFEWKREECFILRKPDPPVLVAVTKEPAGRLKTSSVQILDYNLNRFDINDRKGLEILMLTALLTFHDANDAYHTEGASNSGSGSGVSTPLMGARRNASEAGPANNGPPAPPPKPPSKTGVDRIAEIQAMKGEYNEVFVEDEGTINDYGQYCGNLLQDDAILFITIKSATPEQVPKVLQVVEQTKRIRHKAGLSEDEELHQYVLYDTISTPQKGPRRINLDDDGDKNKKKDKYTPPNSLTVHLSKIPMPELQPKASTSTQLGSGTSKKKDKKAPSPKPSPSDSRPSSSTNIRPRPSSPHAHQIHPSQPSPSPSQLNNPSIYTAAPPQRPAQPPQLSFPQHHQPHPSPASPSAMHGAGFYPAGAHHAPQSASPTGPAQSLYGPFAAPLVPPTPSSAYAPSPPPAQHGSSSYAPAPAPGAPPAPPPPNAGSSGGIGIPGLGTLTSKPLTPSNVVSGLFGVLHRR